MDDIQKAQRFMELDRRFMGAMMRIMPGVASEDVVAEFQSLQQGYGELLQLGPPQYPLYQHDDLRRKMAECEEYVARTYDSLRDNEPASRHYEQAALAYEALGQRQRNRDRQASPIASLDASMPRCLFSN